MLSLLLSMALAAAPVTEEQTYDRLFQEAPTVDAPAATPDPGPSIPTWLLPVGIFGLAAGFLAYKRFQPVATPTAPVLRVIQRQGIGDRNALVLVEVVEPGGESRRLLIGTGAGAPALLADLGLSEELAANRVMPEKPAANNAMPEKEKIAEKPVEKSEKTEARPRFNIADEILAERAPAPGRSREFSKLLARIGEDN
jgi:hypothetical protein